MRGLLFGLAFVASLVSAQTSDPWVAIGPDGEPRIHLYFFWSTTCPHCAAAHPHIAAIPNERPWVVLHELELTRDAENVRRFEALARLAGGEASAVPSFLFCGEMATGWDGAGSIGDLLKQGLDACRARVLAGRPAVDPAAGATGKPVEIPFVGAVDPARLSLPALTLVLAGLDAFNPCAFFVLLFLLSMMAHQKSRARMLAIGGTFVTISGLMYFAFMAAWLNVFQLFGHLDWVTLAAGAVAIFVGIVNVKDFFRFGKGLSLSIPESKKPDIFRRARAILDAERLPAMLAATVVLAVAANFYELLCTAGFPMVYTRLLTLAELPTGGRYVWLAIYNLIYVLPLAAIVVVFARTLGARKLTEREGRLLKLLSGLMMLGLGALLLFAPERIGQAGIAFGLMAAAVVLTWIAARLSR
jgi:hypothetical protein